MHMWPIGLRRRMFRRKLRQWHTDTCYDRITCRLLVELRMHVCTNCRRAIQDNLSVGLNDPPTRMSILNRSAKIRCSKRAGKCLVIDLLDGATFLAPKFEPRQRVGEHAFRKNPHMAPAWEPFFWMLYSSGILQDLN